MNLRLNLTFTLMLAAFMPSGAHAEQPRAYKADYRVSLYGLSIAEASFSTDLAPDGAFKVKGHLSSSGIGSLFDDTSGTLDVEGRIGKSGPVPGNYVVKYKHGNKDKSTTIAFSNGDVANTVNVPPVRKKGKWVDLKPEDLRSVFDPISGVMVVTDDLNKICNRTLHLYDGQTRVDLVLSANGGPKPLDIKGFKGQSIDCAAKFVPISGYRSDRKAIEYLKNSSKIGLTFASFGNSAIYSPVQASIGTRIGTVKVAATRLEVLK